MITESADRRDVYDVLVLGSRAYGPLRATLLGSVSASVTARAPCPTIVLPRAARLRSGR